MKAAVRFSGSPHGRRTACPDSAAVCLLIGRAGIWPASPSPISSPWRCWPPFPVFSRPRPDCRWPAIGWHLLAGLLGLAMGFTLFALGWIGGGDAKLFAAVALWLGLKDLMPYALVASVFGGALTIAVLLLRQCPLPALLARQGWIVRLHDARSGIPYGVALAWRRFSCCLRPRSSASPRRFKEPVRRAIAALLFSQIDREIYAKTLSRNANLRALN